MIRINTLKLPLPACFMILASLPICYLGYLRSYSEGMVSLVLVLYFVFTFGCIVFFGLISKPEMSIYAFLFLWCFFPKKSIPPDSTLGWLKDVMNMPPIIESSLFSMFEITILLAIIVRLVVSGKAFKIKQLRRFNILLFVMVISAFIISLKLYYFPDTSLVTEPLRSLYGLIHIVAGLIFFSGCMKFIKTQKQIEIIFSFFVLSLIILSLETILLRYLNLIPQLNYWAISERGLYISLIFSDYNGVGVCSIIAFPCFVYFILSRKNYRLFLLMPVLLLPLINGYERAQMVGLLTALTCFAYMIIQNNKHRIIVIGFGVVILCTIYSSIGETLIYKTTSFLGGEVRPDYLSADSFFSRVGAWLRCIDVFIRSFPFGVGPGVVFYYMGSSDIPSHFVLSDIDLRAADYYDSLRYGVHMTGSHNLYLQYIAEYGLLGVITIISFVCLVLSRFLSFKRRAKKIYPKYYDYFLAQVCCYSIMIGLGVFYIFQHSPVYYFLFLLFLYLIFLIPKLVDEGNTN